MLSHSCEYPAVRPRPEFDISDHEAVQEPFIAWNGLVVLIVTAFSSYVL